MLEGWAAAKGREAWEHLGGPSLYMDILTPCR